MVRGRDGLRSASTPPRPVQGGPGLELGIHSSANTMMSRFESSCPNSCFRTARATNCCSSLSATLKWVFMSYSHSASSGYCDHVWMHRALLHSTITNSVPTRGAPGPVRSPQAKVKATSSCWLVLENA